MLGTKESPLGSNRGSEVDLYNKKFGLIEVPWCATGQSYYNDNTKPKVKSARAKDFAVKGFIYSAKDVLHKRYIPKSGDYLVKARRGGNHVDQILIWDDETQSGILIGCNVNDRISLRQFDIDDIILWGATVTKVQGNYNYGISKKGMQRIKNKLLKRGLKLELIFN
jgi:hypothetical protein